MKRHARFLYSAIVPIAALLLVAGAGPDAAALDILDLCVNHINMDDQIPPLQGSAAVSALMTLNFLWYSDSAVTLQEVMAYGQSLDPDTSFALEFDPDVLAQVLNHFSPDPAYTYGVIATNDPSELISGVGYWMNRYIDGVDPLSPYAPALLPLLGSYFNWVVVTGTRSESDPYTYPDTTMYGLWLDDPRMYNEYGLTETRIYYATDPSGEPSLVTALQPMSEGGYEGLYMAVVPIAAVPEPATIVMLGLFGAGMAGARRMRRK